MSDDCPVSMRRSLPFVLLTIGVLALSGLVFFSPFALVGLARFKLNWFQLSDIGQTYGAVSALLSSLALVGVATSLLYQSRDGKNAREQTTRRLQFELIRMAMGDPSLMTASGAPWDLNIPSDNASIRQYLYVQLWVSFLAGNFMIGELPESAVRHMAAHELFRSEAGRNYWAAVGRAQMENSAGRRRRFFRILDDVYKEAILSGAPTAKPISSGDAPAWPVEPAAIGPESKRQRRSLILVAAMVAAVLATRFWRSKNVLA